MWTKKTFPQGVWILPSLCGHFVPIMLGLPTHTHTHTMHYESTFRN